MLSGETRLFAELVVSFVSDIRTDLEDNPTAYSREGLYKLALQNCLDIDVYINKLLAL